MVLNSVVLSETANLNVLAIMLLGTEFKGLLDCKTNLTLASATGFFEESTTAPLTLAFPEMTGEAGLE